MPYRIQNLLTTRKDPTRRGSSPILARKPVLIGTRVLRPGETCTIGDAHYERSKARIKEYEAQGVITLKYFVAPVISVDVGTKEVTVAQVFSTDGEQLQLLSETVLDTYDQEVVLEAGLTEDDLVVVDVADAADEEVPAEVAAEVKVPVAEEKPVEKVEEKKPSRADDLDALLAAPPKRSKKG